MDQKDAVIITGSSGFIGSALVHKLARHFTLLGFDRVASQVPPPQAECICIDLTDEDTMKAAFERVRMAYGRHITSVIHLAAYYDLSGEASPLYEKITIDGTKRLLQHLKGFEVEQFIFTSTMLVHAPTIPGQPITEDSPIDPRWPYPMSKVETEALIKEQHGDIPIVILRLAGVYDDWGHNAFLSQQISRIYEKSLLARLYPGDLTHGQSFIHLEDLGEAVLELIEKRKELPSELVMLLGEPRTLSYDEIQRTVSQLLYGEALETKSISKGIAKTGAWLQDEVLDEKPFIKPWMIDFADDHYELDISRAKSLLGWEPKQKLQVNLPKIICRLKSNPKRWYRENRLDTALVSEETTPIQHSKNNNSNELKQVQQVAEEHHMSQEHDKMMLSEHRQTLWAHFVNIGLGAWLVTSPFVFGLFNKAASFSHQILHVTVDRNLASPIWRSQMIGISDIVSGLLIILFAMLSLSRRTNWAQWANTLVGLWLLFAPLFFWVPSAVAYNNDFLVGMFVITFSILVPMMPGMSMSGMMDKTSVPPGWTYCPSTWAQRLPIIVMGLVGLLIARQLTAYQLGYIISIWEPFFSGKGVLNGTETIITSDVSKAWPIPDAGLGAISYALEILMASMGDRTRWRTMPWMVTFFGILVVPLGVVSIYFIIIQPIVIGTWCTLCLLAALAMLIMIPFALDELVAMGQFLLWSHRVGKPFWKTFFMGDAMAGGSKEKGEDLTSLQSSFKNMMLGVTLPWTLVVSALLGVLLMFTRLLFDSSGAMANNDHLVGALVVTVAIISMAEVARLLRFMNLLFGIWLIAAPWVLQGANLVASWFSVIVGLILIALSLPRGKRSRQHYGSWDNYIL